MGRAADFAAQAQARVATLRPLRPRVSWSAGLAPERLRSALFHGLRSGSLGLLRDLQDLELLAAAAHEEWGVVFQAARSVGIAELDALAARARSETEDARAWLRARVIEAAPKALASKEPLLQRIAASLVRPRPATVPDEAWAPIAAGLLIFVVGLFAWLAGNPWLLPSLGPSAYLIAEQPAHPSSRAYNTLFGHLAGLAGGFAAVAALGAWDAPDPLVAKTLTLSRVGASGLAIFITLLVALLLRASHPPAAATALLVSLGSLKTGRDAASLIIGALITAILGEGLRRLRLGGILRRHGRRASGG